MRCKTTIPCPINSAIIGAEANNFVALYNSKYNRIVLNDATSIPLSDICKEIATHFIGERDNYGIRVVNHDKFLELATNKGYDMYIGTTKEEVVEPIEFRFSIDDALSLQQEYIEDPATEVKEPIVEVSIEEELTEITNVLAKLMRQATKNSVDIDNINMKASRASFDAAAADKLGLNLKDRVDTIEAKIDKMIKNADHQQCKINAITDAIKQLEKNQNVLKNRVTVEEGKGTLTRADIYDIIEHYLFYYKEGKHTKELRNAAVDALNNSKTNDTKLKYLGGQVEYLLDAVKGLQTPIDEENDKCDSKKEDSELIDFDAFVDNIIAIMRG